MKYIELSQGLITIVDDDDFDWLNVWKWCAIKSKRTFYAVRTEYNPKKRTIYMHKEILSRMGFQTDHKDHNGLNNQRSNLRVATVKENNRNKLRTRGKKYKGVYFQTVIKRGKKYTYHRAKIMANGQEIQLGGFSSEAAAAKAYNQAALKYHGEFAHLNQI